MSVVKLDTGFNIELTLPIAPFHKRLFAWGIDLIIQGSYMWIANLLLSGTFSDDWASKYPFLTIVILLPTFLYHLLCEVLTNGQSPGKKAMNIKVITTEGGQPTISQYLIRWSFKTIDLPFWILAGISNGNWPEWTFLFLFSGLICMIASKKSQRIGDLIAGTVLINTKTETSWQDTVFMEVEDDYQPVFPQVMQLSDKDINTIKTVLKSASMMHNTPDYLNTIALKLKSALKIETDLHAADFLELLLKDYNYLSTK